MKLGIVGLPGCGKSTVFDALTRNAAGPGQKKESRIGTVQVPDSRIDVLSRMYKPRKTIYAQVEYFLPGFMDHTAEKQKDQTIWTQVRDCQALIHVVRNFRLFGGDPPDPVADLTALNQELVISDLVVVEKRLERLEADSKRGHKYNPEEHALLQESLRHLENEIPLRAFTAIADSSLLRGYAFLSAKPMLILFNNEDEDETIPQVDDLAENEFSMVIRGKLEQELAQMSEEEAREFLSEFSIKASAMDRVIHRSYELLGLISFFTVGEDEVRAWTISKDTLAVDAAETIHSDMKKGFIRAEVISYEDLMDAGSYAEARKKGTVRLEGKTYKVQNGDIMNIRFNI
jgi:GTP-binding protein YchF